MFADRAVAYRDVGDAPGRQTLLLIPGLGGAMSFWGRAVEMLVRDYRVVSFDHPGVSGSADPVAPTSVKMLAQLSVALLDYLQIDRAVYVGHSMGGIIAQTSAVTYPQRVSALVLSSTWLRADHYFHKAFAQRRWMLENAGADIYARAQTLSVLPPEYIANNPRTVDAQEQRAAAAFRDPAIVCQRIAALLAFDGSAQLAQIRQPVLVVYCEGDSVVPPHMSRLLSRELRACAQQSASAHTGDVQELALTGGGHFSPLVIPEEFVAAVLGFLGFCHERSL